MRPTYEAIYEDGRLTWLGEQPRPGRHRVLITVLDENAAVHRATAIRRVLNDTRGAWGHTKTMDEIDTEMDQLRDAWTNTNSASSSD